MALVRVALLALAFCLAASQVNQEGEEAKRGITLIQSLACVNNTGTNGTLIDCNENGITDECEILSGAALDCNLNGIPDECDLNSTFSVDCNNNTIPDECDTFDDCNNNTLNDLCDIDFGISQDCDNDTVPDECTVEDIAFDCNLNDIPDSCDVGDGSSNDTNSNGIPDECESFLVPQPLMPPAVITGITVAVFSLSMAILFVLVHYVAGFRRVVKRESLGYPDFDGINYPNLFDASGIRRHGD